MLVALYEPEIPPNTGNIARLCAAFDIALHLIEPLGFSLADRYLKRAGLDYWKHVEIKVWPGWQEFRDSMQRCRRFVMATTRASQTLQDFQFQPDDALIFGPETRGLPADVLALSPCHIRIPFKPMQSGGVRSLNLSTACGIILYTALAQCNLLASL